MKEKEQELQNYTKEKELYDLLKSYIVKVRNKDLHPVFYTIALTLSKNSKNVEVRNYFCPVSKIFTKSNSPKYSYIKTDGAVRGSYLGRPCWVSYPETAEKLSITANLKKAVSLYKGMSREEIYNEVGINLDDVYSIENVFKGFIEKDALEEVSMDVTNITGDTDASVSVDAPVSTDEQ